ncbi:hypothetical protein ABVT39_025315 [Epinephelus coioides]
MLAHNTGRAELRGRDRPEELHAGGKTSAREQLLFKENLSASAAVCRSPTAHVQSLQAVQAQQSVYTSTHYSSVSTNQLPELRSGLLL